MTVNKVILVGHLGGDPELKYTQTGQPVCSFSVATNEAWTDKSGQRQEHVEWHKIVVWGKQAETAKQYLTKGRQCYVEGKLKTRSWEDKDGVTRYMTEVHAETVRFLGGTGGQQQQRPSNPHYDDLGGRGGASSDAGHGGFTDDIPF